jgi:hypothetical protein
MLLYQLSRGALEVMKVEADDCQFFSIMGGIE